MVRRVLHLAPARFGADGGVFGGGERYAFELARHMAAEVPTALLTFGDRDRRETIDGLEVRVLGHPWHVRGQAGNPFSLRMFGELRGADVVHCHQQHIVASSAAAAFCRLTGRRVFVSDLGGGGFDVSAFVSTDGWYDGHLHISEYSRKIFGHAGNPRAHVILGGVDARRFSPGEGAERGSTVVFVGRILPHKGIDKLVRALPTGLALEVIGRPMDARYLADLQSLGAGKQIVFRHDCDDAQLIDAYRRALCIVLPSVYRTMYGDESRVPELLGQALLEGMACGAPAVCTNVASLPEVVDDGVTGFVVPPNDPAALGAKIAWLAEHPGEAAAMGRAGRRRVLDKFTWPAVVRRCLDVYERNAPATGAAR
jgi:alpha-maltose-1-phosphate synthase